MVDVTPRSGVSAPAATGQLDWTREELILAMDFYVRVPRPKRTALGSEDRAQQAPGLSRCRASNGTGLDGRTPLGVRDPH
jgi:hypothetical protein